MTKRLLCALIAVCLICGMTPISAGAADGLTVTKTDIPAHTVLNYDGYGSILMSEWEEDAYYPNWERYALIDVYGNYVFPYTEDDNMSVTYWYAYSGGYVMVESSASGEDFYDEVCSYYYDLDGSIALETPDLTAEILAAETEAHAGDEVFCEKTGSSLSQFRDGVAFVRDCYTVDRHDESVGTSYQIYRAYLMDDEGRVLYAFPDSYNDWDSGGIDGTYFFGGCALAGDGLISTSLGAYDEDWEWYTELYGYIDYSGNMVLDMLYSDYSNLYAFSEGLARVVTEADGLFGFIDTSGELVIPAIYEDAWAFDGGLAAVQKDGLYGAIDTSGNVVIPFQYEESYGTGGGYMAVGANGKYGLVDSGNNVVVPLEYDDITAFTGGAAYAIKDGYVYIITEGEPEPQPVEALITDQKLEVNGEVVDISIYNINNYNYFKLRDIAALVNGSERQFSVGWDSASSTVSLTTGDAYTVLDTDLQPGGGGNKPAYASASTVMVNGAEVAFDAYLIDNFGYYGLRDLCRVLDIAVTWNGETRTMGIDTTRGYGE